MKATFFAVLFLFPLFLQAQDTLPEPEYFPVIAYWSAGDSFRYDRIKGEKNYENGLVKDSSEQKDQLLWVVSEATDTTYVVRVFPEGELCGASAVKAGLSMEDLMQTTQGLDFMYLEFVTDAEGSFLEFRHIDEMYKVYAALMDTVITRKFGDQKKQKDLGFVLDKIKSRAFFEATFLEEIPVMQKFYGLQYALDSVWEFDMHMSNPLNSKEVITIPNELLTTMPAEWGGLLRLENTISLKGEQAKAYVKGLFSESGNPAQKADDLFKEKPLTFEFYISYAIYPDTGVLHSMYYTMTSFLGGELYRQKYTELFLEED